MIRKIFSSVLVGAMLASFPAVAGDDIGQKFRKEVKNAEKGTSNLADQAGKGAKKHTSEFGKGMESLWEKIKKQFGGGGKKD